MRGLSMPLFLSLIALVFSAFGASADPAEPAKLPWNLKALSAPPKYVPDPTHGAPAEGVKAIFYEGVPYHGKPTRVFAYIGIPKTEPGHKLPAMVLVHGGGGSAFIPWVKLWMDRGYAAISMDTCGYINEGRYSNHTRDPQGGPPGWGGFDQIDEPITDQWTYHAVADAILAHSLLRSMPEVDPNRVGLTGISWGGYLTCIIAAADPRFRFAAPVYGCGFLGEDSVWVPTFQSMGKEKAEKWLGLWDPSVYLPQVRMPMLWVDGTNDFAYPPDSLQKSYRLPKSPRTLCMRVRMPHGHGGAGENPAEILAFANSLFQNGKPLAKVVGIGIKGSTAFVQFKAQPADKIVKAEFNYTTAAGPWQQREWKTLPAQLLKGRAEAALPPGVTACYFNIEDAGGLVVSSEHICPAEPAGANGGPK